MPLTAVTSLIAISQTTTIIGMFLGPVADRYGYRPVMIVGMSMLVLGMLAGGFFPWYGIVFLALFLAALGKSTFDPAVQAYTAGQVPFQKRGLVIGILEISWAGCTLVGIPLIAILIERYDWRAPFFALGGLGIVSLFLIVQMIPQDRSRDLSGKKGINIIDAWRQLIRQPTARGALLFSFFVSIANDNLFVVYGAWLEATFDLGVIAIGFGTVAIGVAELSGELLTAFIGDRFGLKRSVLFGLALSIVAYSVLPLLERSYFQALAGLFFIFLFFEFTIVAFISLCTELQPEQRATMMAAFFAASGLGRFCGAFVGGYLWLSGGMSATAVVSSVCSILGFTALIYSLKDWRKD